MSFYGVYMVIVIAGIGYMTVINGLLSAIVAHIVIDWILISRLRKSYLEED